MVNIFRAQTCGSVTVRILDVLKCAYTLFAVTQPRLGTVQRCFNQLRYLAVRRGNASVISGGIELVRTHSHHVIQIEQQSIVNRVQVVSASNGQYT